MQKPKETTLNFQVQQNKEQKKSGLHEMTVALVAAAFGVSVIMGLCSLFKISVMPVPLSAVSVVMAFVVTALWRRTKVKIAGLLLPAAAGIAMLPFVKNGIALMSNSVIAVIGAESHIIYLPFPVGCSEMEYMKCIAITCCLMAVWVAVLCVHLLMTNNRITALFLLSTLTVLNLMFGTVASWTWLLVSAVCTMMVLAKGFIDEEHVGSIRNPITGSVVFILAVAAIMAVILFAAVHPADYQRPELLRGLSDKVSDQIELIRYGDPESRAMPSGDFNDLGNLEFSDTVMLKVTADKHESLYLRGFVGSQYTSDGWTVEDGKSLYKYADAFYWLHKEGMFGQNQIAAAAQVLDKKVAEKTVNMMVETAAADSRYYYTPYEVISLTDNGNEMLAASLLDDGEMPARGWSGQQKYQLVSLENQVKRYPSLVAELDKNQGQYNEYLAKESHYNAFVYDTYTAIPKKTADLLDNHLKAYGSAVPEGENHGNYTLVKEIILDYLNKEIKYSAEIQQQSDGTDFMTDFLEISKSGYSVHYATAAALMFRYYGIPARYVEGYLITPEAVKGAKDNSTLNITDKNAHAWVEYYQDGIGWIPFEVTPPYMDVMEQPEMLTSSGTGGTSGLGTGAAMEMAKDNYEPEEPEKEDEHHHVPWKKIVTSVAVLMVAVLLLAIMIRLILRKRKLTVLKQSFELEDRDSSVINMFAYILTLHGLLGTEREQEIYELYQKAAFSAEQVSQEERNYVFEYKNGLLSQIRENCKITKRFVYRWIKGIY